MSKFVKLTILSPKHIYFQMNHLHVYPPQEKRPIFKIFKSSIKLFSYRYCRIQYSQKEDSFHHQVGLQFKEYKSKVL